MGRKPCKVCEEDIIVCSCLSSSLFRMVNRVVWKLLFKTISIIRKVVASVGIRLNWLDRMVLVRMDGGICSQMHFYMIGHYFEEKGFTVKYDLSWFLDSPWNCL